MMKDDARLFRMRELWQNYRSEVFFLALLSAFAVLSHALSQYIPVDFFDHVLTPIQNAFTIAICLTGAWLLSRHTDGLRIRRVWAWTLLAWGVSDTFFLFQTCLLDVPVLNIGSDALTAYELLAGNFLGWLMLFYPTEALRPGWLTFRRAMMQLLPMVALVALDYLVPVNLAPLIACYPAVLAVLLASHIRAYRIWCEENYSSMDNIDVQWIVRYLMILLVIGASFLYMCLTHNPVRAFTQQWLLLFLFVYGTEQILFRRSPWDNLTTATGDSPVAADEALSADEAGELPVDVVPSENARQLEQWMEQEKPYLVPDFKLVDLQRILPINRTYLSQFINTTYGCTFYQFVTRYRIEEAKRLMREYPDLTVADVAVRSGFSSRIVFSRTFTRETGLTPREWSTKCNKT